MFLKNTSKRGPEFRVTPVAGESARFATGFQDPVHTDNAVAVRHVDGHVDCPLRLVVLLVVHGNRIQERMFPSQVLEATRCASQPGVPDFAK